MTPAFSGLDAGDARHPGRLTARRAPGLRGS
jgi:hypothetical protein